MSKPVSCRQAIDLWNAYTLAISDYNRAMRAHTGPSIEEMNKRIAASDKRDAVRQVYLAHVHEHGCGVSNPGSTE